MKKRRNFLPLIIYLAVVLLALSWFSGLLGDGTENLTYSQLRDLFVREEVKSFVVKGDRIQLELYAPYKGSNKLVCHLADPALLRTDLGDTIDKQYASGVLQSYDFLPTDQVTPYSYIIPLLLVGIILLVIWFVLIGRVNAGNPMQNFGRARTVLGIGGNRKITFADVAGAEEEKQELQEIVEFLRDPKRFLDMGAKIPHGILLVGPPGTGKTLLARAVAGEAEVQFLSISGSDFMELYVGVGASRVRDLFDQAKRMAPSIIFIDEIDAVGRQRGSGLGGGHDEREQTLNQMLVEMDGFTQTDGVIVLAATNRADILDPALLRPGRFDRQIYVSVPDSKGREEILKVHAKNKRLDESVDLHALAMATSGFTGADLSNLLNEAAIRAVRSNRPALTMEDLNESMMKVLAGPEKRSSVRLAKDQRMTAIHEAGHAVAMYRLPEHDPVRHISIIPRGQSLGATWSTPREDSTHRTRNAMYEDIVALLGGRVAEALFVGDISTGASSDIDRATKLARDMVARFGMCEKLGTVSYTGGGEIFVGRDYEKTKSYSEKVAATIDDEVKDLIDRAYAHCKDILTREQEKLMQVVEYLLENETMTGAQFAACMEGLPIEAASATSMLDDFKKPE